jgi:DNA polymerase/3'-5' exonuclease PolX
MNENARIAANLHEAAERLEGRGGNRFGAAAFRSAADVVREWPRPLREIHDRGGRAALEKLPGVGRGIAGAVAEMLATGRWRRLERMRPERSFFYTDDDGVEHENVVIETRTRSRRPGRAAIAELLRQTNK